MSGHFRNVCPVCGAVTQCRCPWPKSETRTPCAGCKKHSGPQPPETQKSITAWADATFGPPAELEVLFNRMDAEWCELIDKWAAGDQLEAAREAADVYITMVRWLEYFGVDLHDEVNRKMAINRARRWRVTAEGVGQHVPEGEP